MSVRAAQALAAQEGYADVALAQARRAERILDPNDEAAAQLQVLEVLAMKPGQSIFTADLWQARSRLARLDWISSAEIHRRYPDAIFVTLVEKRPFALWQAPPDNSVGAHGEAPIWVVECNGKLITSHEV